MTQVASMFLEELLKERLDPLMVLRVLAHQVVALTLAGKNEEALKEAGNASRIAAWVKEEDHANVKRYADTMSLIAETNDLNHLNNLLPFWVSDNNDLFSMDNVLIHRK